MKKLLSLALAATLAIGTAVPAFADTVTATGANGPYTTADTINNARESVTVKATYTDNSSVTVAAPVYYVTISWVETNTLTYDASTTTQYAWDLETHTYKAGTPSTATGWDGQAQYDITITNDSDAPITYSIRSASETYHLGYTPDVTDISIASAANAVVNTGSTANAITDVAESENHAATASVIFAKNESTTDPDSNVTLDNGKFDVGTITVTLSAGSRA